MRSVKNHSMIASHSCCAGPRQESEPNNALEEGFHERAMINYDKPSNGCEPFWE
jgi:hypothetical protein